MTIIDEINSMLTKHGMLINMSIVSSLSSQKITRNVFSVVVEKANPEDDCDWWFYGEFWARDLMTGKPYIAEVWTTVRYEDKLMDVVFQFRHGLIPKDFYPDYANAGSIV